MPIRPRSLPSLLVIGAAAACFAAASPAATFHVTTLADSGAGSFRQAILDANSAPGADTILFDGALSGTIELASALPDVTGEVVVTGPGAMQLTVDANQHGRVLVLDAPAASAHTLTGLTLTGGQALSDDGPGIWLTSSQNLVLEEVHLVVNATTNGSGGGLKAEASTSVSIIRSVVAHNQAYAGGGVFALGTLTVSQSTFHHNSATLQGGAIAADTLSLFESTLSRNEAPGGEFTIGQGGGVFLFDGGQVTMYQATVVENVADSGPGVYLLNSAQALDVGGTIIAGNRFDGSGTEGNCNVSLGISEHHNLSGDASCGFTGASDLQNTDPELLPLLSARGLTPTHVPLADSPVIDAGAPEYCVELDQRGFARPVDGDAVAGAVCDIGATEYTPGVDDALVSVFADGFESGTSSAWSATVN